MTQKQRALRKILIREPSDTLNHYCYSGYVLFHNGDKFSPCLAYVPSTPKFFGMFAICKLYNDEDSGKETWTLVSHEATVDVWDYQEQCINKLMGIIEAEQADVAVETT